MKKVLLTIVLIGISGAIWYFEVQKPDVGPEEEEASHIEKMNKAEKAKMFEPAKELTGAGRFINIEPFRLKDEIGKKVILIDFWTYSCINCQRTTPYLNSWWDKYNDKGLLIVGVHTPEFEFEKNYDNLLRAVQKFEIEYPVVQDNSYSIWRSYRNQYWPRKYLIDIDGYIVYDHIGEGAYEETEMKIQELLNERMAVLGEEGKIAVSITEEEENGLQVNSPETYFGSARNENFGSGTPGRAGSYNFIRPAEIKSNTLYLTGQWQIANEYAQNISKDARIIFKYNAKEVYLVANSDKGVKIKVLQDGKSLEDIAGEDISKDVLSEGFIKDSRLYKLINNSKAGEHTLEIIIEGPGLKAFTFTFG